MQRKSRTNARRQFLTTAIGMAATSGFTLRSGEAYGEIANSTVTAADALEKLQAGNQRCINGSSVHGHDLNDWRERFLSIQKPFATVLGCSDSRVPPELLFDQGYDALFVVRVAGNVAAPDVIASVQYAIEHLDNKLIVVLGHQNCGAVTAALEPPSQTRSEPPELRDLLDHIRPAIASVDPALSPAGRLAAAVEANARASASKLRQAPYIKRILGTGEVKIVSAVYQLDSGRIKFLK